MADIDARPPKKRRFFVDDDPPLQNEPCTASSPSPTRVRTPEPKLDQTNSGDSNVHTLRAVVGDDVPVREIYSLLSSHGNNLEQAINAYYDGSWQYVSPVKVPTSVRPSSSPVPSNARRETSEASSRVSRLVSMPEKRYIGSVGVAGWTTRSGVGLLKPADLIKLDRTKQHTPQKSMRGGKIKQVTRKMQDIIVRFTNTSGEELGRLEKESAAWISTLIDQNICSFDAHCIYAPERIRTNDTVFLQLRCFLLKRAFGANNFIKPQEDNRQTGIFESKESLDERDLRLRQVALVKLFTESNLDPSRGSDTTAKHKREGILQAAEIAEQYEVQGGKESKITNLNEGSSPPSEEHEDGEELEQDQLDSLYKKAQTFDFDTPEATPAETFKLDLRKYQKQALHWMLNKESNREEEHKRQSMHPLWEEYLWPTKDADEKDLPLVNGQDCFYVNPYSGEMSLDFPVQEQSCLGGILADEMGLGKTIEMLSLVHSHLSPELEQARASDASSRIQALSRVRDTRNEVTSAPATTLVVAPMSLLAQWASEAEKASQEGSLKTLLYYGTEKNVNLQALCDPANVASAPNVIITSYGTVLSEFSSIGANGGERGSHGGLFSVNFWRIILDEAHMIKNRQSKTAKACYELAATHRWVLTGTPIVNRLEDLFSLVHFLRVEPWSNFSFWKTFITTPFEKGEFVRALDVVQTVLEPLVMRRTKDMKTSDGEALVPLPVKTVEIERIEMSGPESEIYGHIYTRAKRTFTINMEAGTLMKSYTTIFAQILRLRQSCCHPILTRNKNIVAEEEDAAAAADIANGLADDMDLSSLLERFEAEENDQDASKFGSHVLKQIQEEAEMECPICSEEPMEEQAVTGCWHSACKKCLLDYIEHQSSKGELPRCFNCREPINARDVFEVIRHEDETPEPDEGNVESGSAIMKSFDNGVDNLYTSTQPAKPSAVHAPRISLRRVNQLTSSKINALVAELKRLRKSELSLKTVVFSQFTSFLDIIANALTCCNIVFLRFDGSMSQKERAKVLAEYANTHKFTVLLLSLRAGGVGLNLTMARKVYMMDPWWSWAVEAQAIDRVHRMGQTEEVQVKRFIVTGSIEEKMLRVQDRKKFIASSLGMMSEEERKQQRVEDIRELLS